MIKIMKTHTYKIEIIFIIFETGEFETNHKNEKSNITRKRITNISSNNVFNIFVFF